MGLTKNIKHSQSKGDCTARRFGDQEGARIKKCLTEIVAYFSVNTTVRRNTMKSLLILLLLMTFTVFNSNGQVKYVPATLNDAILFLLKDFPDSLKERIKHTKADSLLYVVYPYYGSYKIVSDWIIKGDTTKGIKKFLSERKINRPFNQQAVIFMALQKALLTKEKDAGKQAILFYQQLERKWNQEDGVRFTTDSLRGFYIPVDLQDCIVQIDKMLADSVKEQIRSTKPENFFGESHLNFGMYLRNSWQLWMGSRLTKYFNEIGIDHPDTMSGAILAAYYQSLTAKDFNVGDYEKRLTEKYGKYKRRRSTP